MRLDNNFRRGDLIDGEILLFVHREDNNERIRVSVFFVDIF